MRMLPPGTRIPVRNVKEVSTASVVLFMVGLVLFGLISGVALVTADFGTPFIH